MGYSSISDHLSMVMDGHRNAAYARAMRAIIRPETTVMDLGAGLGVHGLNAARLGAASVHLVEPAAVLEIARRVASANGMNAVHCHPCRVEELQLEGRVDVIVSVCTGNFLLTEDLLPSLFYARDKFLKPGGHMLPDRARMEVLPVAAPAYYRKHIDSWSAYPEHAAEFNQPALCFDAVRPFAANSLYHVTRKSIAAVPLSTPAVLTELDFTTAATASCDCAVEVQVERDETLHGWLGWFQMRLGDEWLSTSGEPEATHWRQVFLPLEQPLQVRAGQRLGFALKRADFGEWTWTTQFAGNIQRQSTFLSQPITPDMVRRASVNYQPVLNRRGAAARWLLDQFRGTETVAQLAIKLCERYPDSLNSQEEALQFLGDLTGRYGDTCAE